MIGIPNKAVNHEYQGRMAINNIKIVHPQYEFAGGFNPRIPNYASRLAKNSTGT